MKQKTFVTLRSDGTIDGTLETTDPNLIIKDRKNLVELDLEEDLEKSNKEIVSLHTEVFANLSDFVYDKKGKKFKKKKS